MKGRGIGGPRVPADARAGAVAQFAADVQYYLALEPRQLPSRYFYDELGSALFEAICRLPWYRITRTESRLLAAHGAELWRRMRPLSTIVELGSGSGEKLRTLLEAAGSRRDVGVHLVDLSASALEQAARLVAPVVDRPVVTHRLSYEEGLRTAAHGAADAGRALVLFLGSNIGNFDPPAAEALLRGVRASMAEGDALLLGADAVKPERDLLLAYDDPLGVTAAFNRNLLVRINRELGGTFDVEQFAHEARWNAAASRVEMHLVARSPQSVRIDAAHVEFDMMRHEAIWTESSYKYRPGDVAALLSRAGFRVATQWLDETGGFILTLGEP